VLTECCGCGLQRSEPGPGLCHPSYFRAGQSLGGCNKVGTRQVKGGVRDKRCVWQRLARYRCRRRAADAQGIQQLVRGGWGVLARRRESAVWCGGRRVCVAGSGGACRFLRARARAWPAPCGCAGCAVSGGGRSGTGVAALQRSLGGRAPAGTEAARMARMDTQVAHMQGAPVARNSGSVWSGSGRGRRRGLGGRRAEPQPPGEANGGGDLTVLVPASHVLALATRRRLLRAQRFSFWRLLLRLGGARARQAGGSQGALCPCRAGPRSCTLVPSPGPATRLRTGGGTRVLHCGTSPRVTTLV